MSASKKSTCDGCGKKIKFIRAKGKLYMVEPAACFFIPSTEETAQDFIMANGTLRKGKKASDGIAGYIPHNNCIGGKWVFDIEPVHKTFKRYSWQ